jgi:hypothetical protein
MYLFSSHSAPHTHTTHIKTQAQAQGQRSGCLSSGTPTKGSIDTVCSESQVFQIVTGNTQTTQRSNTSTGTAQWLPQLWYSYQRFYRHCVFRVSGLSNRHWQPQPQQLYYSTHYNFSHFMQADTPYALTTAPRHSGDKGWDLLVADLAHLEQPAARADVALLDLVGAVHDRRAYTTGTTTTRL